MQRRSVFQASWALVLLVMSLSVSCTSALAIAPVADRYRATDYVGAYERLQALRSEYLEKQGPLLYALDAGMLTHHGRMGTESNRHLDRPNV